MESLSVTLSPSCSTYPTPRSNSCSSSTFKYSQDLEQNTGRSILTDHRRKLLVKFKITFKGDYFSFDVVAIVAVAVV